MQVVHLMQVIFSSLHCPEENCNALVHLHWMNIECILKKMVHLDRRFQKVMVEPPTVEETIQILTNIKSRYEDYHNVTYSDDAIDACVKLSDRYMTDRLLPDKAIDVLDEVGARVHLKNINVPEDILDLEKQIEDIKLEKNKVVKSQRFEEAASLRDTEKRLR